MRKAEYKKFCEENGFKARSDRISVVRAENGLTGGGGGGIIRENKSKKPITRITDEAINKVPKVEMRGYTDEQCRIIQQEHKNLLRHSRDNNDCKEVAFSFREDFTDKSVHFGSDDKLDFGTALFGKGNDLFVMHNHPRNSSYSATDIIFMIGNEQVKSLSIVKNNGSVEILTKGENFNAQKFKDDFGRFLKKNVKTVTDSELDKAVEKFLTKQSKEGGMLEWIK